MMEECPKWCFLCGPCRGVISRKSLKFSLVVRQSAASKGVNTEFEGSTALETVTRQRLVKTQQTEKNKYVV
jgi:hypothetical protein